MQWSGIWHVQPSVHPTVFRNVCSIGFRAQKWMLHRVKGSDGYVTQGAGLRSTHYTGTGVHVAENARLRSAYCTGPRAWEFFSQRAQGTGFRSVCCLGHKAQECMLYKVQGSGVYITQDTGFGSAHRGQECMSHRAWISEIHIAQGTELVSAYRKGYRVKGRMLNKIQGSGLCVTQGARVRIAYHTE